MFLVVRRDPKTDVKETEHDWGQLERLAQDRIVWRNLVGRPYPSSCDKGSTDLSVGQVSALICKLGKPIGSLLSIAVMPYTQFSKSFLPLDREIASTAVFGIVFGSNGRKGGQKKTKIRLLSNSKTVKDRPYV